MKSIVLHPVANISIVALLVIGLFVASFGDTRWRVLSQDDMKDTRGGATAVCTVILVITVAAALCTLIDYGWKAIKKLWNGNKPGDKTTQKLPNQTIIRQKTFYADGHCVPMDEFEIVQEYEEVTPNTCCQ